MGKDLPKDPQGKSKIFSAWYVLTRGGDGGGGGSGGGGGGGARRCCGRSSGRCLLASCGSTRCCVGRQAGSHA